MPLTVKIADFGASKHFDGITAGRAFTGTQPYMATEVWCLEDGQTSEYTTAVDLWSLGYLVYFMMAKKPLFPEYKHVLDFFEGRITFPPSSGLQLSKIQPSAIEFMVSLAKAFPEDRVPAEKTKQHSWLAKSNEEPPTVWSTMPSDQPPGNRVGNHLTPTQAGMVPLIFGGGGFYCIVKTPFKLIHLV